MVANTVRGPGRTQRARPASSSTAGVRRRAAVYGIPCWAVDKNGMPIVGKVIVGYVGQTVQTTKEREEQHRESQAFSDLIVGGSWVIEEGWWTAAQLDAREQYYIRNGVALAPGQAPQRPVYNYDHNLDNPHRIERWRAIEHRQRRESGWVPPPKGDWVPRRRPADGRRIPRPRSRTATQTARPSSLARWWDRRRWWVIGLAVLWLALFVASLRGSWLLWNELRPGVAASAASTPFAAVWGSILYMRVRGWWRRQTRPKRRRRR